MRNDSTSAMSPARTPLPPADVTIDDDFWAPRRELVRTTTLRQQEHHLRTGGQFHALTLTWRPGDPNEPHIFWESDVAKWIEAASYCLARTPDAGLEASVDEAIELLRSAQQPDGYLNVYFTVVRPGERFTDLRDAHELYCAGHLIEAGVAHHQATGKTSLLDVVRRYADLIDREFGPGGSCEHGYDGHQEIELALVKLYRATGERRYLQLSRRLIDARGQQPFYFDVEEQKRGTTGYFGSAFSQRLRQPQRFREYNQSHRPVVDQAEAVGHSVRAMYMYAAMTDLAQEDDDAALLAAVERLWNSVTDAKLYLTGGIGSDPSIEGFGPGYDLPDVHGYAETCAAIGLVMWAQRMANSTGEARYVDTLERALFNGVLAGASADGTSYFYGNPLASHGRVQRDEWFGVACCPPNLARLLSSLELYAYSQAADELVVNLYMAGSARFHTPAGEVTLRQLTGFPSSGDVTLDVDPAGHHADLTVSLRLPGWSQTTTVHVNGTPVDVERSSHLGYLPIRRTWTRGDRITVSLDMTPRRTWASSKVASTAGRVALQRGPVVYCLEGVDHDVPAHSIRLPRDARLDVEDDALSGLTAITANGSADVDASARTPLYQLQPPAVTEQSIRAVPYFSWANRGRSTMTVWIREDA